MMRLFILISLCCIAVSSTATTLFPKNKSPSLFKSEGNVYTRNNPYNNHNPNNIYSQQQDRFNPNSMVNNNHYKEEVLDTKNNSAGFINPDRGNSQSILNPYTEGNSYPNNNIANPYNPNTSNHTYGQFQDPYADESARNTERFQRSLFDERGYFRGNLSDQTTQRNSTVNPYNKFGNPFNPSGLANPYKSPFIP